MESWLLPRSAIARARSAVTCSSEEKATTYEEAKEGAHTRQKKHIVNNLISPSACLLCLAVRSIQVAGGSPFSRFQSFCGRTSRSSTRVPRRTRRHTHVPMSDLVDLPVSPEAKEVAEAELAKLAPTPDTSSSSSGEATTAPPPEESTTMTDVSLSPSPTPVAASLAPTPSPSMVSPSAAPVALPIAAVPPTPVLSPSASGATGAAAAPGVEPLCLSSGWLLRRNAGLLGNKTQKVFGRLTLGLSPTVPSMMTCYETDQPGSVKVCSVAIDGSMTVLAESSLLQWTLKTRGGVPSTLAISAASMQSLTGVKVRARREEEMGAH